jgi:hypothetical protein
MTAVYFVLALIGAVLPLSEFAPWVVQHGLDVRQFSADLLANRIGGFFGADVLISAITLIVFMRREGARHDLRHLWLPILATCLIGVSCGLPLFLYLRERQLAGKPTH